MRINWFCPLPPAKTGIADYADRLIPELAGQVDLEVWTDQDQWAPWIDQIVRVRRFKAHTMPIPELNRADLNIYHIGNNATFHTSIWQVSRRHPGLVVLHDAILHDFALGLGEREYVGLLARYYGSQAVADGTHLRLGRMGIEYVGRRYPMVDCAVDGALAVLVHGTVAQRDLQERFDVPCIYAPMPYRVTSEPKPEMSPAQAESSRVHRLIVFGHLSYNRRIDVLLEALAGFEHRDRFRLDIYGQIWDPEWVQALVRRGGLARQVTMHGSVPKHELDAALDQADVAINLRFPTRGEASLSQLVIWDHALPSLVTRADWYATLPEDCVAHVRPDAEVEDIRRYFVDYLENPAYFEAMGRRGRARLLEVHSPQTFIQAIQDCARQAGEWRRRLMVSRLAKDAARLTLPWLRRSERNTTFAAVGREIARLGVASNRPKLRGSTSE